MPYDPGNFTFSYSRSSATIRVAPAYENETDWRAAMTYNYAPVYRPWEPFQSYGKQISMDAFHQRNQSELAASKHLIQYRYDASLLNFNSATWALTAGSSSIGSGISVSKASPSPSLKNFYGTVTLPCAGTLQKPKTELYLCYHAEIEEPYGVVNKDLYPDEYSAWKDTVRRSLLSLGRPIDFSRHSMPLISSPFDKFPLPTGSALTFVSPLLTTGTGVAAFRWHEMGNTVSNQRSIDVNSRFNLEALYNKVPYLKKVNRRFSASYRKPASPKNKSPVASTRKYNCVQTLQLPFNTV